MIRIIAEIVDVFELPETDLGYSRAASLAVLLGHEEIVAGYHECSICGALIPPQEFENPFDGKPDVAFGACPQGHSVVDQISSYLGVDRATENSH